MGQRVGQPWFVVGLLLGLGAGVRSAPLVALPEDLALLPAKTPRILVRMQRARLEPDGSRTVQHYRLVRAGREGGAGPPVSLVYRPGSGRARVVLARLLTPGGERGLASRDRASASPAERLVEVDPGPAAPGDLLEVVLEESQPKGELGPDDFAPWCYFGTEAGVDLDLFEVTLPAGRELRYVARGMGAASTPTVRTQDGTKILTWSLRSARVGRGQARPYVRTSSLASWEPVRAWFAPRLARRLEAGAAVREVAWGLAPRGDPEEVVAKAAWRKVALGLTSDEAPRDGAEAVLGREAGQVLALGTGNCADKANLFCALLAVRGIRARPMIISRAGHRGLDPQLPTFVPGDHALVRMEVGGVARWCDPSDPRFGWAGLAPGLPGRLAWDPTTGTFHRIEVPRMVGRAIAEARAG